MNIAVRYQSRGGNTRAVAEIIAGVAGVEAYSIDIPLDENVDVLFIGGGAYAWSADPRLKEYIKKLSPQNVGQIVAFSTAGAQKTALHKIIDCAKESGIKVNNHKLLIRMIFKGHASFGLKGGSLSNSQIEKVRQFTREVLDTL